MAIGNGSGRDIEYEVEPSDPGGTLTGPTKTAMFLTVAGGAAVGVGCLTGFGGRYLVYFGLLLLVGAFAFQSVVLRRARDLERRVAPFVTLRASTTGKTKLPDGQQHAKTFVPGSWVVFYEDQAPHAVLATSPLVHAAEASVVLRRCGTPSTLTGGAAARADSGYFVEMTEAS